MRHRTMVIVAIITLLAVTVLACAGPSPDPTPPPSEPTSTPTPTPVPPTLTPDVPESNYTSTPLALSLWYPDAWIHEEGPDAELFASSAALMSGNDWDTGAAFAILGQEIEEGQTIKEVIREFLDESAWVEITTTEFEPISIGDDRGVITSLEATPMDVSFDLKGFLAGVEHNRLGYVFMGISVADDWPEFGDTLDAMLRSVRFSDPEGTYTSEDLGFKIWYPEDWVLEEDYDQIIFATSLDLIDTGDLEAGAALMIRASSLGDDCLEDWFEEETTSFTFDAGGPTSDITEQTIGGRDGLIFELEGVPTGADTEIKGFVAAVEYEGWGYILLGVAVTDEWTDYAPTLEEMLDSIDFLE
jgi:hypothetical protein